MNPASASVPAAPPLVNDVAGPPPAAQARVASMPEAPSNVVANIPVHTAQAPPVINEDDELDKIMHDVGREMKKEDQKPPSHGLLGFLHKSPAKPAHMQPVRPAPLTNTPPPASAVVSAAGPPVSPPMAANAAYQAPPTLTLAAAKPQSLKSFPAFVLFITFIVTGFLVVAAYAAYRQ
jgi:hypothetical protein